MASFICNFCEEGKSWQDYLDEFVIFADMNGWDHPTKADELMKSVLGLRVARPEHRHLWVDFIFALTELVLADADVARAA
jgi:hypothetical protein